MQKHNEIFIRSIAAFAKSDRPEDWNELMKLFLVRRTRTFIKENYAKTDPANGRKYLQFPNGDRSYFPDRIPVSKKFETTPGDQYSRLYSDSMIDMMEELELPRYGLTAYLDEKKAQEATSLEKQIIENLSRAGKQQMGFCKATFFKRTDSSGLAFLLTLSRISELGWDRYKGRASLPTVSVDGTDYRFKTIADRSGFQILTCEVDEIPTQSLARKLDTRIRRQANDYICIFRKKGTAHDLWMVPVRANEKRDLVMVEYDQGRAEVIWQKIDGITFSFDEQTNIVDLRAKVQGAFAVNSGKVTKDFYSGFKKEHNVIIKRQEGMLSIMNITLSCPNPK